MEVIILAGGLGTRLRSEVNNLPKCMAPVAGKPFLLYLLNYLNSTKEVTNVILSVGYLRDQIFQWIETVKHNFHYTIDYAIEESPLGTGGAIRLALSKTKASDVVVMNGDTFYDVDLHNLYNNHILYPSSVTLALKPMSNFDRYGTVSIDSSNNSIIQFREKQYCSQGLINGGVYIINQSQLDLNQYPEKFSFENDVLVNECMNHKLFGVIQDTYFIDIGIPTDYIKANSDFNQE